MIDAHHHIWRQKDLSWLSGPEQPRIFGSYRPIMRDYLIDEYRSEASASGVQKSVYVQANWPSDRALHEALWVQSVADAGGWPHAIVGYADFTVPDVRPQLDQLSKVGLMRGVRQQIHWHENPLYRFAARADLACDPGFQANVACLAAYDWSFDLQVFPGQMAGAMQLAEACPEVTFILQHAGMLEDTSEAGREVWGDAMTALSTCPNVVSKLSAFGTFIHRNDPAFIARMVQETVAIFGAERCLWGSNFPIEKLWTTYDALVRGFHDAVADLPEGGAQKIFNDTAARVYRL